MLVWKIGYLRDWAAARDTLELLDHKLELQTAEQTSELRVGASHERRDNRLRLLLQVVAKLGSSLAVPHSTGYRSLYTLSKWASLAVPHSTCYRF